MEVAWHNTGILWVLQHTLPCTQWVRTCVMCLPKLTAVSTCSSVCMFCDKKYMIKSCALKNMYDDFLRSEVDSPLGPIDIFAIQMDLRQQTHGSLLSHH